MDTPPKTGHPVLTNDQIAFFNEFGFLVFRQLFDSKELETMALEGDAAREEIYQGHEDGPRGSWVPLLRPSTPFSASLLEDARFHSVATQTFDDTIFGVNVDMLKWKGDTGWHRDLDAPGNTGMKLIYYFESLRVDTGALRVIPGSHRELDDDRISDSEPLRVRSDEDVATAVRELDTNSSDRPTVVIETEPGDVIAFAMPLLHSSSGGGPNRRLGSVIYWMPSPTKKQLEARRQEVSMIGQNHERMFNYPADAPFCHPDWVADAADSKRRTRWVEQLRDIGWITPS
jgi:hypothetical protein